MVTTAQDVHKRIQFRDSGIFIDSTADGKIRISADGGGSDDITLASNTTISAGKQLTFPDGTVQPIVITSTGVNAQLTGTTSGSESGWLKVNVGNSVKRVRLYGDTSN